MDDDLQWTPQYRESGWIRPIDRPASRLSANTLAMQQEAYQLQTLCNVGSCLSRAMVTRENSHEEDYDTKTDMDYYDTKELYNERLVAIENKEEFEKLTDAIFLKIAETSRNDVKIDYSEVFKGKGIYEMRICLGGVSLRYRGKDVRTPSQIFPNEFKKADSKYKIGEDVFEDPDVIEYKRKLLEN